MRSWYARRIDAWEKKLAFASTNRVVRPFEWGLDWARRWPHASRIPANGHSPEALLKELNLAAIGESDVFFGYESPRDFRLEGETLRFTSPVHTPDAKNNIVHARLFRAEGRKAVVLLPHWNAPAEGHVALCRGLQRLGITTLRVSLPYHDHRMPPELERADYAVSSNIGRTIDATRQAVIDVRCCYDWLETQGYDRFGIVGTSLGSCYAYLVSAHDERVSVNAFNHCSTYFADVVWSGLSTRHIRQSLDGNVDLETLREVWSAISPVNYLERFAGRRTKSLFVYTTYDTTFLPELSRQVVAQMRERKVDHQVSVLPCGHYTLGATPFKFVVGYQVCAFLKRNL